MDGLARRAGLRTLRDGEIMTASRAARGRAASSTPGDGATRARASRPGETKTPRALRREEAVEPAIVTEAMVLEELKRIGFANMLDYLRLWPGEEPAVDLSKLDRAQGAAIAELTVEGVVAGRGADAREQHRLKLKLHDKIAALVKLGQHLGMFKERVEHSGAIGLAHEEALAALAADDGTTEATASSNGEGSG
jgi:terminase small subunit-like protein